MAKKVFMTIDTSDDENTDWMHIARLERRAKNGDKKAKKELEEIRKK